MQHQLIPVAKAFALGDPWPRMPASHSKFVDVLNTSVNKEDKDRQDIMDAFRSAGVITAHDVSSATQPLHLLLLLLLHPPGPLPALGAEQQLLRILVLL